MDALVQRLDQQIHILAAPVGASQLAAAAHIALPCALVGEVEFALAVAGAIECAFRALFDRVGIKIVVHVDAVDVVALDDVEDDGNGLL